ncbi:MAG: translocation/assembly module TamB domain-containing protein, partial [Muribaculaceae bacterium]|nr:translocation/assembly module TamB domain-containing protein [Muribaculaceae bacterium]
TSMSTIDSLLMTRAGGSAINVQANLNIQRGAKLNAFLTSDGKDRVQLEGSGNLKYTLDFAGKSNFVGSYVIENGNVRYTPPVISQKLFDIASGSSVTWTGDIAKPELNITATNTMKASVSGNDRPVEFLVTAKLGKTLADMDLQFDLSCDNNMSVQNELQSMTSAQRSNAAMNLLLYNTYTGTNSTGNINLSSTSALYSFLQSQLNSWAASNLKGVDLTFGINQYDTGVNGQSSTETSYSYRLSKSLFNDRFKVVVGGEYSTDASQEENFSSNLINDISFEYHLNQSGTKYLRLFRHTGFESVIEGEITETGVGFVMKRKLSSLKNWFHSNKKSKTKLPSEDNIVAPVDSVATVPDEELSLPNDQQP